MKITHENLYINNLDSASVTAHPTILQEYVFGSSLFDAYTTHYYLTGITSNSGMLKKI